MSIFGKIFKIATDVAQQRINTAVSIIKLPLDVISIRESQDVARLALEHINRTTQLITTPIKIMADTINIVKPMETNSISSWDNREIKKDAKTYIVIHGFQSGANEQWVKNIESALSKKDPSANILALDWLNGGNFMKKLVNNEYTNAADMTAEAGKYLAQYLKDQGLDPSKVTLIGHSLGSHVAGIAGKEYQNLTKNKLSEILALDPAGVENGTKLMWDGLRNSSADRVVSLHTSRIFGTKEEKTSDPRNARLSHLDLHINSHDIYQPDANAPIGNHSYPQELLVKLLKGDSFKQADGSVFNLDSLKNWKGNKEIITKSSTPDFLLSDRADSLLSQSKNSPSELYQIQPSFAQEFNWMEQGCMNYAETVDHSNFYINAGNSFQSGANDWLIGQSNTTNHSTETRLDVFQSPSVFNTNLDMFGINFLNSNNSLPLHMGSLSQVNDSACYLNSPVDMQNSNNIISGQSQNAFMKIDGQSFV
jgi:pimeloyl-ACP methyl ester carboxylesterase